MLIGVRSLRGARSLVVGRRTEDGAMIIASESCALHALDAELVHEVNPGEMVVVHADGRMKYHSSYVPKRMLGPCCTTCSIELAYISRSDSILAGQSINRFRRIMGMRIAEEYPINIDAVVAVANSAIPVARAYA